MHWFMNLSTTKKLMLSFGFMAVIVAGVGYMGIHGMDEIDHTVHTMVKHTQEISHLENSRSAMLKLSRAVSNGVLDVAFKDFNSLERRIADSKKFEEEFTKSLNEFQKIIWRDTLKAKATEVEKAFQQVAAASDKILDEAKANKLVEAHEHLTGARAVSNDLEKKLAELLDMKMAAVETDAKSADELNSNMANFAWALVAASIVGALALGFGIARMMARPLRDAANVLDAVSKGDLTPRLDLDTRDELGLMAKSLNLALDNMAAALQSIHESAQSVATSSEELTSVSHQMSSNSEETAAQAGVVTGASEDVSKNVQTVAAGSEEMSASIKEIAKNTSEAARIAREAVNVAEHTNQTIAKLGESSAEIGNVLKVITSIAEQTNLLALNATIEAARAGEAGKGFAVVANEVKELAKQTGDATEDIGAKISAIQHDTQGAVAAIQQISGIINQVNDIANTIASAVEEQSVTTNEMSRNVAEASKGSNEIVANITGVAQAAQSTASGATQTQAAAQELARLAVELQTAVSRFRYQRNSEGVQPQSPARGSGASGKRAPAKKGRSLDQTRHAVPVQAQGADSSTYVEL